MAGHIARQWYGQPQKFTDFLQTLIFPMRLALVLFSGILFHVPYDRQQIRSPGRVVLVDDLLHGLLPPDKELLSRLLATVGQNSIL